MHSMVHSLRTRRGMAAATGAILVIGLGGWGASRSTDPVPSTASWLMVELPQIHPDDEGFSDHRLRLASRRKTQSALVVSPAVLADAAERLRSQRPALVAGQANPVAWLHAGIKVNDLSDDLFTISMPGEPREHQALIVNAVTSSYLEAVRDWETGRLLDRTKASNAALAEHRNSLLDKRKALREAQPTKPGQAEAIRDEIAVLEEVTRRLGVVTEQVRLEAMTSPSVRLIALAGPG